MARINNKKKHPGFPDMEHQQAMWYKTWKTKKTNNAVVAVCTLYQLWWAKW